MQQVTAAEPAPLSCAFAGSAFCRKVREELSGDSLQADKAPGPPLKLALHPQGCSQDPAATGPGRHRALGGQAGEDGTAGWSLGW